MKIPGIWKMLFVSPTARMAVAAVAIGVFFIGVEPSAAHAKDRLQGSAAQLPDNLRVLPEGQLPHDSRLGELRHLDGHFPFQVPKDLEEWGQRRQATKHRLQYATGLWPMPQRPQPQAVIHGKVEREGYTVEKVYFESYPNHFVTGSLYRPRHSSDKSPAVLCPYGHWPKGRFQDLGIEGVQREIASGAERHEFGGRHPLQARCVQLAKMGCVVFMFDMLGYADSQQIGDDIAHRLEQERKPKDGPNHWGFLSTQAELRMLSPLGLQTYNSLCALDFVAALPDVDATRIGVTGGSGGATQTLMMCALDDRIAAAFPVVMVSTAMQGGCPCENACCLRVGVGNVDFAALFAPKPMAFASANDWTKEFHLDGFPEIKQVYAMFSDNENTALAPLIHHRHNYNYESRSHMYEWFNKHLQLGFESPIVENDYVPLTVEELSVWDAAHPAPRPGSNYETKLLASMQASSGIDYLSSPPKDQASLDRFREIMDVALQVALCADLPKDEHLTFNVTKREQINNYKLVRGMVEDPTRGTELPTIALIPEQWNQEFMIWADGTGKQSLWDSSGAPNPQVSALLDAGYAVVGADLLYQGEFLGDSAPQKLARTADSRRDLAAYTYGYNPTLFAHRTSDLLTLLDCLSAWEDTTHRVHVIGLQGAAPWVIAARAVAGDKIATALVDTESFRFAELATWKDQNFLPGAVKYGDLPAMIAMSAPHPLFLNGESKLPPLVQAAYDQSDGSKHLHVIENSSESAAALINQFLQ